MPKVERTYIGLGMTPAKAEALARLDREWEEIFFEKARTPKRQRRARTVTIARGIAEAMDPEAPHDERRIDP